MSEREFPERIRLQHRSGHCRDVDYFGIGGEPLRAQIEWDIAGAYEVSLYTGRIIGPRGPTGHKLRMWRVCAADLKKLRADWKAHKKTIDEPVAETREELEG